MVTFVDPELGLLFTRGLEHPGSHLWRWDRDTTFFREGEPADPASLRPGERVNIFAEITAHQLLVTRIELHEPA